MTPARLGGALFMLGLVALPIAAGPATITSGPGSAVLSAGAVLALGVGAALIAIAAPRPLHGRLARVGLALLSAGAIGVGVSAIAGIGYVGDPLSSWAIVLPLLVGLAAFPLGLLAIGAALLRSDGRTRWLGVAMLAGAVVYFAGNFTSLDAARVAGAALVVLGLVAAIGLAMGFRRDESMAS